MSGTYEYCISHIKHYTEEGESRREKQDVCAQVGVENVDREQWVFGLAVRGRRAQRGGRLDARLEKPLAQVADQLRVLRAYNGKLSEFRYRYTEW